MEFILSEVGVHKFIEQARKMCPTVIDPFIGGKPSKETKISFDTFVKIISKFVKTSINLDASINQDSPSSMPELLVWGIRDPGIRNKKGAKFLPGHQQGAWSYYLCDAIRDGILPQHIQMFRENLNLLTEYGIDDNLFFQIPTILFKD
ncbi:MAG: hypothetical protein PVH77_01520 [Phycisphaerales bacterium]|jgi:hypothetical protein